MPLVEFVNQERDVSTSLVAMVSKTLHVENIVITNRTSGAITLTIRDKDTTPYEFMEEVNIPRKSLTTVLFRKKFAFVGGLDRQAGALGLNLYIRGEVDE